MRDQFRFLRRTIRANRKIYPLVNFPFVDITTWKAETEAKANNSRNSVEVVQPVFRLLPTASWRLELNPGGEKDSNRSTFYPRYCCSLEAKLRELPEFDPDSTKDDALNIYRYQKWYHFGWFTYLLIFAASIIILGLIFYLSGCVIANVSLVELIMK